MKKHNTLVEVASRLPLFNGKKYYEYNQFDYEDFAISEPNEGKTFNQFSFNNLYETLLLHFNALALTGDKQKARLVYFNSILHAPQYFDYASTKETLKAFYSQLN